MSNRYGVPQKTVQDKVRFPHAFADAKHGLAYRGQSQEGYADEQINRMSNAEFLAALSEAIEEYVKENTL